MTSYLVNQSPSHLVARRRRLPLLIATCIVIAVGAIAATFGSVAIPLDVIARIVAAKLPGARIVATWTPTWETILFDIRLPRITLAALVGG
ncbi:MAG: hypothetical protein N2559_16785, partial [Anaerolineae bacterium]|nr:hypothetical protein [Anaerolineae bacterium]